jgi:hypothetical protein
MKKEKLERRIKDGAFDDVRRRATFAGEPTYFFKEGDKVQYGAWQETVVTEVIDGGTAYRIRSESKKKKLSGEERVEVKENVVPWISLRPLLPGEVSSFSCNEDIRIYFNNSTVESLLGKHFNFGVDFNPDYQRDFVWEDSDKELLLDSIFMGADIGKFVFRSKDSAEWLEDGLLYEIIDGKQRMITLLEYYENRFPYKGFFYNDLSPRDKRRFKDTPISIAEVNNVTKKDTLRIFLMLNRGGRPVSEDVIQRAQDMLEQEVSNEER